MRRIHFDTEFTSLEDNSKIISIGFVCADIKESFYAELIGTYFTNDCSDFCKSEVLKNLDGKNLLTIEQLKENLSCWFNYVRNKDKLLLISDSTNDWKKLNQIFEEIPNYIEYSQFNHTEILKRKLFKDKLYRKLGLRYHHSLDDAIVNKEVSNKSWSQLLLY